MAYQSLYNKYRPQDFASLVGENHIRTALMNALAAGKIAHAYLFAGPRGTGKTSTARILAKAVNCEHTKDGVQPCNQCESCRSITQGTSMDVIEIDAASNRGIDEIRTLKENISFSSVSGKYKVYIIDEVHMLSIDAFNALLKTLEEPPGHVIFVLATTESHKIPATIHSRCQRYDFRRVSLDDITKRLEFVAADSGIDVEAEALRLIAIQAEGGLRDALSLLDQCAVMADKVTVDIVRSLLGIVGREGLRSLVGGIGRGDLAAVLASLSELLEQGKDIKQIVLELAEYLRALLLYKANAKYEAIYLTDTAEALAELAPLFTQERILAATKRLHQATEEMRFSLRLRIILEMCLYDLCRIEGDAVEVLTARVAQLEAMVAAKEAMPMTQERTVKSEVSSQMAPSFKNPPLEAPVTPGNSVRQSVSVLTDSLPPAEKAKSITVSPTVLWQEVEKELQEQRKRSILAYAKLAKPLTFEGGVLTVEVGGLTAKDKLEQPDYRELIETIISHYVNGNATLICVQTGTKVSEQVPESVKMAINVFGGKAVKQ